MELQSFGNNHRGQIEEVFMFAEKFNQKTTKNEYQIWRLMSYDQLIDHDNLGHGKS